MWLSFTNGISLTDTVKLFEKHALEWFCSEVEKNGPGLSLSQLINVDKIKLIDVAVHEQVATLFIQLG